MATFFKDSYGIDCVTITIKEHDSLFKQIAELQEKLADTQKRANEWRTMYQEKLNTVSKRNLQISDLKKKYSEIVEDRNNLFYASLKRKNGGKND